MTCNRQCDILILRGNGELTYVSPKAHLTPPGHTVGEGSRQNEMAFIPALNTLRVSLEFTHNGRPVVNVFYLKKSAPIIAIDLVNVGTALVTWWDFFFKPYTGNSLSLNSVNMRDMTTDAGIFNNFVTGLPSVGALAQEPLPNNVALVSSFRTLQVGRSYRGRVYQSGLTETQIGGDAVTVGLASQYASAWSAMNSYVGPNGFEFVVASFRHNNVPRGTAVLTPVTSIIVNTRIDTQRRRMG